MVIPPGDATGWLDGVRWRRVVTIADSPVDRTDDGDVDVILQHTWLKLMKLPRIARLPARDKSPRHPLTHKRTIEALHVPSRQRPRRVAQAES